MKELTRAEGDGWSKEHKNRQTQNIFSTDNHATSSAGEAHINSHTFTRTTVVKTAYLNEH